MRVVKSGKSFVLGVCLGLFIAGCAATSQYTYYVIDPVHAKLLGHEPKDDLPLAVCEPTDQNKAPCVGLKIEEYTKILQDMADLKDRLIACEGHS